MHKKWHEGFIFVARVVGACVEGGCQVDKLASVASAALLFFVLGPANALILPPNLPGAVAGGIPGNSGVSQTGAATYSVPLPIPPGTAGLIPTVELNYSSQAGDGILGRGWSVAGQFLITRCAKTFAQDGVRRGVALTSEDQFCLNGQRLLIISGTHGAAAEYRTEVESFSQIVSIGSDPANGPEKWIVRAKNGLIYTYGSREDSRVEAQGRSVVLSWAIARVEDRRGNYYDYDYSENNAQGEHFPTRIRYTGNVRSGASTYNVVSFVYEPRPDPWRGYVMGSTLQRKQRLIAIRTSINTAPDGTGGTLVREFRVSYVASPNTGQSLVQSLSDCDGLANCLPPTTFGWTTRDSAANTLNANGSGNWAGPTITIDDPVGHPRVGIPEQQVYSKAVIGDFNGDGVSDIFYSDGTTSSWKICLSTKINFNCSNWSAVVARSEETLSGDFNGDGLTDIAIPPDGLSGVANWTICLSTGSGFSCSAWAARTGGKSPQRYLITDSDGDGRDDLLLYDGTGGNYLCRSNGSSFDSCSNYFGVGLALSTGNDPEIRIRTVRRGGDLNGDGRLDLIKYVMHTGPTPNAHWETYLATDAGFVQGPQAGSAGVGIGTPSSGSSTVLDYNGDSYGGYGDTAAAIYSNTSTEPVFEVCQSTGTTFLCTTRPNVPNRFVESFGDFDKDGRIDFLNGNSICQLTDTAASPCIALEAPALPFYTASLLGDFNGDGLLDHAYYYKDTGQWVVRLTGNGGFQDLMSNMLDGVGKSTQFSYSGMEDAAIYTRGAMATYPARNLSQGPALVSQVRQTNGQGGWLNTDYKYESLRTDVQGRGPLGFYKITAVDQTSGVTTSTTLRQQYPYVGMPSTTVATQANGVNLSASSNVLTAFSTSGGANYPYVKSSTVITKDLSGALVSTVTSSIDDVGGIDAYGNITSNRDVLTEPGGDSYTTVTASSYENRAADWVIALLTSRAVTKTTTLTGTGLFPPALILTKCVSGGATVSPTRATLSCSLSNTGQTAATSIVYSGPAGTTVSGPSSCGAGSDGCGTVLVQSGTAPGTYAGTVTAATTGGSPGSTSASLVVNPSPPSVVVSISPSASTLEPTPASGRFTFTNNGQTPTTLTFSGPAGIAISPKSVTCPAGSACAAAVTVISPTTAGSYSVQLTVLSSAGGTVPSPSIVLRVNTRTPPAIGVTGSIDATTVAPTAASATLSFSNGGQTATTLTFSGPANIGISPSSVSCPAGSACTTPVTLTSPTTAGFYGGNLTVSSSVASGTVPSPIAIALQVNTPPAITFTGSLSATAIAPTAASGTLAFSNGGQTATMLTFSGPAGIGISPASVSCPANSSCTAVVTVTSPTAAGVYGGQLSVSSSAGGTAPNPIAIALRVNTPPAVTFTGSLTATAVAPTAASGTLSFTNSGQTATTLTFSGPANIGISPSSVSCPAGSACTTPVTLTSPTTAGFYGGNLTVSSSVASGTVPSPIAIALQVNTPPAITFTGSLSATAIAPTAASGTLAFSNGGQTATMLTFSGPAGIGISPASVSCPANSSCTAVVTVTSPTAAGVYGGQLNVLSSNGGAIPSPIDIALRVKTQAAITYSGSINASTVTPTAASGTVTFTNVGETATTLTFSVSGGAGVSPAMVTCPANSMCTSAVTVTSPVAAGTYNGQLTISSSATGTTLVPVSVALRVKTQPSLTLTQISNANLSYSIAPTAAIVTYQLGNSGEADAVGITYTNISGVFQSGAPVACAGSNTNCGTITLSSGTAAGVYGGSYSANPASGSGANTNVALTVMQPVLTFDAPTSYAFGTRAIDSDTYSPTFYLRNSGTATANSLNLTSSNGFPFDYVHTNCGTSLDPGQACAVVVRFYPTQVQQYNGTVVATANGAGASFGVSGTGVSASTTVTGSSSPSSVVNVQTNNTQQFVVTISNVGGAAATSLTTTLNQPYSPSGSYSVVGGNCGDSLLQSSSCTVVIEFQASCAIGNSDAALAIGGSNFPHASASLRTKVIGSAMGCD